MQRLPVVVLASTLVLAGCSALGGGEIATRADGVRTFAVNDSLGCKLGPDAEDPSTVLRGTLVSDASREVDSVWLATVSGDAHVIWPDTWVFSFGSDGVAVTDEDGYAVATEGDEIVLADHRFGEAAGTKEDPYVASGRIGPNCYPRP